MLLINCNRCEHISSLNWQRIPSSSRYSATFPAAETIQNIFWALSQLTVNKCEHFLTLETWTVTALVSHEALLVADGRPRCGNAKCGTPTFSFRIPLCIFGPAFSSPAFSVSTFSFVVADRHASVLIFCSSSKWIHFARPTSRWYWPSVGSPRWPSMTGSEGATTEGPSEVGCAFLLGASGGCLQWAPCGRYIGSLVGRCGMAIWAPTLV